MPPGEKVPPAAGGLVGWRAGGTTHLPTYTLVLVHQFGTVRSGASEAGAGEASCEVFAED